MKKILYIVLTTAVFIGCSSEKKAKVVTIEPSEEILKFTPTGDFSVVLDDMKIEDEVNLTAYKHKYSVLKLIKDSLHQEKLPWKDVNKKFFDSHKNDLGMEILSRHKDKISRVAQPVGFGWSIGNEKHGEWVAETPTDSTKTNTRHRRRWSSFGTSPFLWYWLGSRRSYYRNDYNRYQTNNRNGQAYYGSKSSNGKYDYGTRSSYQENKRSSFFSRRKTNSSRWNRLNKSSSRYSKGSSTRSRSGGSGK